mmetsp:Transcript_7233/g.22044  ORF Transcript_7233/g.22044 Transcript_7233/m.22044 type:complete len:328 (-) Transcript_7233:56-1039(-)
MCRSNLTCGNATMQTNMGTKASSDMYSSMSCTLCCLRAASSFSKYSLLVSSSALFVQRLFSSSWIHALYLSRRIFVNGQDGGVARPDEGSVSSRILGRHSRQTVWPVGRVHGSYRNCRQQKHCSSSGSSSFLSRSVVEMLAALVRAAFITSPFTLHEVSSCSILSYSSATFGVTTRRTTTHAHSASSASLGLPSFSCRSASSSSAAATVKPVLRRRSSAVLPLCAPSSLTASTSSLQHSSTASFTLTSWYPCSMSTSFTKSSACLSSLSAATKHLLHIVQPLQVVTGSSKTCRQIAHSNHSTSGEPLPVSSSLQSSVLLIVPSLSTV